MSPSVIGFLWCGGAAFASALSTYLIKLSSQAGADWNLVRLAWLGSACASYGLGFICYSIALQKLQISLAYPVMTAITLALVTLVGYAALQEPMSAPKLAGIVLVGAGAFLLAR